jgi:flagella basal body P-ring formation protein FlgA
MIMSRLFWSWSFRLVVATTLCLAGVLSARAAGVQVPVPRITIYPGQVIEQEMLVDRVFRSSAPAIVSAASSSDALIGKVARQTLLPGHPIATNAIRDQYAVIQGKSALIVFRDGALTITATGVAMQSGGKGDVVSVRNVDSGRTVKGTVEDDGSINVGGP